MWLLLITVALIYLLYRYFNFFTYWSRRNVSSLKPLPVFGNLKLSMTYKRSMAEDIQDIYDAFPDKRYVGLHMSEKPYLMIRDLSLLKLMYVKDFDTFKDHQEFFPDNVDPLWDKNVFAMKGGKKWHELRSVMTPSFTSGKLKIMFHLILDCATQFSEYLSKNCVNKTFNLEMKSTFARYTTDVTATTAFGMTCNSINDENNEFYKKGLIVGNFQGMKFYLFMLIPSILKMLGVAVFPKACATFFTDIIVKSIKIRKENNIVRPDIINLLLDAQAKNLQHANTENIEITDETVIANAIVFLIGGIDTTATMLSQVVYELAVNPDIQDKLRQEVDETFNTDQERITYDKLVTMKYLDMVISESLRKWPPFILGDRVAVKSFTIEPERADEKPVHLRPNNICLIPIAAIQRDPNYFPDPEKFDPERFNEENKHNIKPFSYLPFGAGPRSCIAPRFAFLTGKVVLVEILRKFEIIPIEKTTIPLQMGKRNYSSLAEEGIWLGIKRRN